MDGDTVDAVMELIEGSCFHSGDIACILPSDSLALAQGLDIRCLMIAQYAPKLDKLYFNEPNSFRFSSSRSNLEHEKWNAERCFGYVIQPPNTGNSTDTAIGKNKRSDRQPSSVPDGRRS